VVAAKAATFKEDMLSVLNNPTAALWANVLRVVSEALKKASEATVSTQHVREVKIYLAVLPVYPRLYAGDELVLPASLAGVVPGCLRVVDALHPGTPLHLGLGSVVRLIACLGRAISLASRTSSPAMTSAASSEIVLEALDILTAHRRYVELTPRM